jgi:hypothetical protein
MYYVCACARARLLAHMCVCISAILFYCEIKLKASVDKRQTGNNVK